MRVLILALLAAAAPAFAGDAPIRATVVSVYDGDTLTLDTGDKVRLRWVNTPELKPAEAYGVEAREAASALVLQREVELIVGATERDGYGRLIAGVRTDKADLSEHLLEQGLGHLFVIPPDDTDLTKLIEAQERARKAGRGIWSHPRYKGDLHITSFHANGRGDDRANPNGEYLRICNVASQSIDLNGYQLTDLSGRVWTFPTMILPAGHTVKVHSGHGENLSDPTDQITLYLGNDGPVWNNDRDRATILDRYGKEVDVRDHQRK